MKFYYRLRAKSLRRKIADNPNSLKQMNEELSEYNKKIKDIHYYPGKFFNASLDKASQYNERCAYLLEGKDGDFVMVQIAGLIAQRIVCRAEIGDVLNAGDRFGMIKFGSRLDLYLPESYVPSINIGDNVLAGQSILGKISTKQD